MAYPLRIPRQPKGIICSCQKPPFCFCGSFKWAVRMTIRTMISGKGNDYENKSKGLRKNAYPNASCLV